MTPENRAWVLATATEAYNAQHIFPTMAACEAALESASKEGVFGASELARIGNNLFGLKQRKHPVYGTLALPTKEFLDGQWTNVEALFVSYQSIEECFADRMETLRRLQDVYPDYRDALTAPTPEAYVIAVSKTWATDANRAQKCLAIFNEVFRPSLEGDIR